MNTRELSGTRNRKLNESAPSELGTKLLGRKAMRHTTAGMICLLAATTLSAQWLNYKTPGIPRKADGKADLAAAAHRIKDGKPDLSGLLSSEINTYLIDITIDLKPGDIQPWAQALYKKHVAEQSRDNPSSRCLPGGPTDILGNQ